MEDATRRAIVSLRCTKGWAWASDAYGFGEGCVDSKAPPCARVAELDLDRRSRLVLVAGPGEASLVLEWGDWEFCARWDRGKLPERDAHDLPDAENVTCRRAGRSFPVQVLAELRDPRPAQVYRAFQDAVCAALMIPLPV